jgi:uroporphyrinogen decarboxylase
MLPGLMGSIKICYGGWTMNDVKETMTSRERIYKALNHQEADRYPIDCGMHFSTGISVFAYYNLRKYLGLPTDRIQIADTVQLLARVDDDVLERFHCDTVILNPPYKKLKEWNVRGDYRFLIPDQWTPEIEDNYYVVRRGGEKMIMPLDGFFFSGDCWLQAKDYPDEENLKVFCREAERIYQETDKFTCLMGEFPDFFSGIDMACDMLTDPDKVKEDNKAILKWMTEKFFRILEYGGGHIGCIEVNGDMGMQTGPFFSPDCFEEFVFPYLKEFNHIVHENSDIKIFMHNCGSIKPFIPGIIEAEVDILNPVQISANNMDPVELKQKFGDKITFWGGGCNTQHILGTKDEQDVRENTRELAGIFKPGGGFVFNQVHNIQGNVPPENIVAMFDEAYKNSFYHNKE